MNETSKPHTKKRPSTQSKPKDNRPHIAFLVLDLASRSTRSKIIRINQILLHANGETSFSSSYFNNGTEELDEQSSHYLGIKAEDLINKPTLSEDTFNFKAAKNIVVWDGNVTKILLERHNVTNYSPIISMQQLVKVIENTKKSIKLNDYALKSLAYKKFQVELLLKKPENKIKVLSEIYSNIKNLYNEKYGVSNEVFFACICRSVNLSESNNQIDKFLKVRQQLIESDAKKDALRAKKKKAPKAPDSNDIEPKKKIIVVATPQQTSQIKKNKPYKAKKR